MSSRAAVAYRSRGLGYDVLEGQRVIGFVAMTDHDRKWVAHDPRERTVGTGYGTRKAAALALVHHARSGHGGRRPGAGRPPSGAPRHDRISITLPPRLLELVDDHAADRGESRSATIARILAAHLHKVDADGVRERLEVTA